MPKHRPHTLIALIASIASMLFLATAPTLAQEATVTPSAEAQVYFDAGMEK
jgi:hypothetical protein